jgi:hypothetical protein
VLRLAQASPCIERGAITELMDHQAKSCSPQQLQSGAIGQGRTRPPLRRSDPLLRDGGWQNAWPDERSRPPDLRPRPAPGTCQTEVGVRASPYSATSQTAGSDQRAGAAMLNERQARAHAAHPMVAERKVVLHRV